MRNTTGIRITRKVLAGCALALAVTATAFVFGCGKEPAVSLSEVLAVHSQQLPSDPTDAAWKSAPVHTAALVLQDMVEPRLLAASTPSVRVQAITDGVSVAFRLAWTDSTRDDAPATSQFVDACAVQLPQLAGSDLPAPQMGESGRSVEMTYWSASWQAEVNGRGNSIQDLYPNAAVDHYPFEAPTLEPGAPAQQEMERRYAPAKASNRLQHPADRPVQDLFAEGPGTITPAPETRSNGQGRWAKQNWEVVLVRPLPDTLLGQPNSQVAFAIWNGSRDEVGARKMRSVWIPLTLEKES